MEILPQKDLVLYSFAHGEALELRWSSTSLDKIVLENEAEITNEFFLIPSGKA